MGGSEIILILLAVLVLFGADKLPEFAKGLGKGLREVKKATDEIKNELTNGSSEIMTEIKNITDTVTQSNNDIIAETQSLKNDVTSALDTKNISLGLDTENAKEPIPYHEQVKTNSESPKS